MCSRSMLVTTANVGDSLRNDRSLSSASATMYWPPPSRALLPNALRRPPMTAVGSRPARSSISATIEVVVVLPCAPAMAMPTRSRISSASISARGITGTWRARAAGDFRVVRSNRRRHDDDVGVADVARRRDRSATPTPSDAQPIGDVRSPRIRSAHRVAEVHEQLGDAAHADAADPDEVHAARAAQPSSPAPPAPAADPRSARPRRAARTLRIACAIAARRRRIGEQRRRRPRPDAIPTAPILRAPRAARGLDQHLRVLALVVVGRRRQRHEHRRPGRPPPAPRASSRRRAHTTRSAAVISSATGSRKASDARRHARALVSVPHLRQVALAGLVDDFEIRTPSRQLRRRRHHGHVDRVRALRAAKDQHPRPRPRRPARDRSRAAKNSRRTGLPATNPFPRKYASVSS